MDIAVNDICPNTASVPDRDTGISAGSEVPVFSEVPVSGAIDRSTIAWRRANFQIAVILTVGACVIALLWLIMTVVINTERRAAIEHARSEGSNLSAAFQAEVTQTLTGVARAMEAVAERMRAAHGHFDIYDWAQEIPLLAAATIHGTIIGPDGIVVSTTLDPHPPAINLNDREHFRIHLDGKYSGLYISQPLIGRATGQPAIQVSQRVEGPSGEFLGVIVFSLAPGQLASLHNIIDLSPHDRLVVVGTNDQVVRVRFGAGTENGTIGAGRMVPPPPIAAGGRQPVLSFLRQSVIDHVTRLHNVRYLDDFPLRVDVALDMGEILRPAGAHAKLIMAIGIIATGMLAGLMFLLVVEIRRRTDREVKLGDEQERLAAEILVEAQVRERLRASEARLRDFAEMASDWFWEMDAQLRFKETNVEGPPMSGGDPAQSGKRPWDVFDTSLAPVRWANLRLDLLARRPFRDFRQHRPLPDGRMRHVSINGVPVFDEAGVFQGYRGTGRDITAKVEAEEALQRSKEEAEASNVAKSAFLANMSHELRTPLNAIIGFAELIYAQKTGRITDEYVEWAGDILGSGRHLLDMINDVLELSRIEAGRYDLEDETVDLGGIVRSCLPMVRRQAALNRVRIDYAIAEKSVVVLADRRAIKQVVLNLLTNAVKFTPGGGVVSIRAEASPAGGTSLIVSDTGIGIDPAALSRLCEPFVQADASTSRKYGGSGLGLAISTKLMDLHGGTLTITSAVGEGTRVGVSFPAERVLAVVRETEVAL